MDTYNFLPKRNIRIRGHIKILLLITVCFLIVLNIIYFINLAETLYKIDFVDNKIENLKNSEIVSDRNINKKVSNDDIFNFIKSNGIQLSYFKKSGNKYDIIMQILNDTEYINIVKKVEDQREFKILNLKLPEKKDNFYYFEMGLEKI